MLQYKEILILKFLDHFDHVKKVIGPDYIGVGSDYDGVTLYYTNISNHYMILFFALRTKYENN